MPGLLIEKARGLTEQEQAQERRSLVLSYRQANPEALKPQADWNQRRREIKTASRSRQEQRIREAKAAAKAALEAALTRIQTEEEKRLTHELEAVGPAPEIRPTEGELAEWRKFVAQHWGRGIAERRPGNPPRR